MDIEKQVIVNTFLQKFIFQFPLVIKYYGKN